ncbi:MAG: type IX secretion system protein PorQ [Ignavibacteria bacterium]|nr:type IX secretion system protein PorQ [Ignavibacteria bacterium]
MHQRKFFVTFLLIVSFLLSSNLSSQNKSTYNFLTLNVDARSSALSGSVEAIVNDVNSIYYNPAGLSTLENPQGSVGFFKYLLDINSGSAAYSQKYKDIGYFGIGIRYINYGSFEKYDETYTNTGTFNANDIAISIGYANKYIERLHYGVNAKFIYSSYDEYSSTAIAADLGLMYQIPEYMLNIGISLLNIGTQLDPYVNTREELPLDLRIGFNKKLEYLPLTFSAALHNLAADEDKFFDRFKNVTVGGEFELNEYVNLRIGYNNQHRQDLKTGSTIGIGGFSAGFGVRLKNMYLIDYSFNSFGKIGTTHRINVGFNLK